MWEQWERSGHSVGIPLPDMKSVFPPFPPRKAYTRAGNSNHMMTTLFGSSFILAHRVVRIWWEQWARWEQRGLAFESGGLLSVPTPFPPFPLGEDRSDES